MRRGADRAEREAVSRQPNILLIMADQLAAPALPCYGHPVVKAPHIGALAARRGVRERLLQQPAVRAVARSLHDRAGCPRAPAPTTTPPRFPPAIPTFAHYLRRAGLPHLPRRQDAFRRARPAARLRGAADHRHLSRRFRLDARLGRAGGADRLVVPQHGERAAGRASPRSTNQLEFDDEIAFQAEPQAVRPGARQRRAAVLPDPSPSPTRTTPTRAAASTGRATTTRRSTCRASPAIPVEQHGPAQPAAASTCAAMDELRDHRGGRPRGRGTPTTARSPTSTTWSAGCWRRWTGSASADDTVVAGHLRPRRHAGRARPLVQDDASSSGPRGCRSCSHAPGRFAPRARGAQPVSLVDLLPTLLELGGGGDPADAGIDVDGGSLAAARGAARRPGGPCSASTWPRGPWRRS